MSSHVRLADVMDKRSGRLPGGLDLELRHVREAIQGIRYGEVRVVIHDGLVTQIDRTEKQRLR
ncbi:MAG: YezD family protein [Isosphaeraceae bacterium]|nr:YezD family protein [Isosphaeraceae bacterium]